MKITYVAMKGFKGCTDETFTLDGLDIFTGTNGSGKTRILQAMTLALSGRVPHGIEDRNIDLIELFSRTEGSDRMEVAVGLEGGDLTEIKRVYERTSKGGKDSVSQSIELTPMTMKTVGDCERKIKEAIGDFPYMLDLHSFIRLSDEKRAELIFKFSPVDAETWGLPSIRERLYAALSKCDTGELADEIWISAQKQIGNNNISEGLTSLIAWLKVRESELKKDARGNQGAALSSIQLNNATGRKSMRNVEEIGTDLRTARDSHDTLTKTISDAEATTSALKRIEDEKKTLRSKIDETKTLGDDARISELQKRIRDLQEMVVAEDSEEFKEHVTHLMDLTEQIRLTTTAISEARLKENIARRNLQSAEEQRKQLKAGKCPTCGQDVDHLVGDLDLAIENAQVNANQFFAEVEVLTLSRTSLSSERDNTQGIIDAIRRNNWITTTEIGGLNAEFSFTQGAAAGREHLTNRLAELERTKISGPAIDILFARLQLEGIKTRIRELDAELTEKQSYDAKLEVAKSASLQSKKAEESLVVVKLLTDEAKSIRREIVRDALTPIRTEAEDLFSNIGLDAVFDFQFEDTRGNEVFKFGWMLPDALGFDKLFIDFDSLSTAQQIFTLVSLFAPLVHRANPNLRLLILDNCEVIHEEYRDRFESLLVSASEKFLDNILIASSSMYPLSGPLSIRVLGPAENAR